MDVATATGAHGFVSTEFNPPITTQWLRVIRRDSHDTHGQEYVLEMTVITDHLQVTVILVFCFRGRIVI